MSKKAELSRDTIRFYEKKGLLKVERTDSEFNNYKEYTLEHLKRLQLIKKAKMFGFTLNEISELLSLYDEKSASCSILKEKVNQKLSDIDNRIQQLTKMKHLILGEIQKAQFNCDVRTEGGNCNAVG